MEQAKIEHWNAGARGRSEGSNPYEDLPGLVTHYVDNKRDFMMSTG
jgi:hypothetical protein